VRRARRWPSTAASCAHFYENALAFTASGLLPPFMGSFRDGIRTNPEGARELLRRPGVVLPPRLRLLMPWGRATYLPHPIRPPRPRRAARQGRRRL